MIKKTVFVFLMLFGFSIPAYAQNCATVPNSLTNGTTTDATQVMGNFTYLSGCLAPQANPSFTGSVGIGTATPAATLDVYGGIDLKGLNGISFPDGGADTSSLAIGPGALTGETSTGQNNVAIGYQAYKVGTSANNVIIGYQAQSSNAPSQAVIIGASAAAAGGFPANPVIIGYKAGGTSGTVAVGADALQKMNSISGDASVAIGISAGSALTSGLEDVFLGAGVGQTTLQTGSNNILIGTDSSTDATGTGANNSLNIGNAIFGGNLYNNTNNGSRTSGEIGINTNAPQSTLSVNGGVAIGTTYAGTNAAGSNNLIVQGNVGIGTTTPAQALEVNGEVQVDSFASASSTAVCENAGVLSSCSSSIRYKENVKDASFGLAEVMQMRPVTFKWKGRDENDLGLIAEEVAKINPLFVTYKNGKIEGVKYAQLTAVLVNAVKELKGRNDRLVSERGALQKANAEMKVRLERTDQRIDAIEARLGIRNAANYEPSFHASYVKGGE